MKWRHWHHRMVTFSLVGAIGVGVQRLVLSCLVSAHMNLPAGNAIGCRVGDRTQFSLAPKLHVGQCAGHRALFCGELSSQRSLGILVGGFELGLVTKSHQRSSASFERSRINTRVRSAKGT